VGILGHFIKESELFWSILDYSCNKIIPALLILFQGYLQVLYSPPGIPAGIWSILGIPWNQILAVVPAKIVISIPWNSGGFQNGHGITGTESTRTESAEFFF